MDMQQTDACLKICRLWVSLGWSDTPAPSKGLTIAMVVLQLIFYILMIIETRLLDQFTQTKTSTSAPEDGPHFVIGGKLIF